MFAYLAIYCLFSLLVVYICFAECCFEFVLLLVFWLLNTGSLNWMFCGLVNSVVFIIDFCGFYYYLDFICLVGCFVCCSLLVGVFKLCFDCVCFVVLSLFLGCFDIWIFVRWKFCLLCSVKCVKLW